MSLEPAFAVIAELAISEANCIFTVPLAFAVMTPSIVARFYHTVYGNIKFFSRSTV